ncbi:error-prone DNA polymerase [Acidisoma cellulosilytica]|uniref:Error-prone DNA polymerase n=1 Tax=Acidisoma cellulosilyticum TaxID=2802395 RepID=A0A963YYC5_9PROT|nr:error-prone DNA polymerase [Acidisoma cellulosilyticum]MCB8879086.1 error-prone DNA polymerase [Acidisoma cellulosilyticum]
MPYVELQVTSHYSFLRGASGVDELVTTAKALGYTSIGLTDRNTVAGMVRAYLAARDAGLTLIPGCRLDFTDAPSLLVYPKNRAGWSHLCQLLTTGKAHGFKATERAGTCHLHQADLAAASAGLIAISLVEADSADLADHLVWLRKTFGRDAYLSLSPRRLPGEAVRLHALATAGRAARLPLIATGDVLYHAPERRVLQDVVTAIRTHRQIDDVGFLRERYADRHLRTPQEMARLMRAYPEAIRNTEALAETAKFDLTAIEYQYPTETTIQGESAQDTLSRLVWTEGIPFRYPQGASAAIIKQIKHELALIEEFDYAPYFLTVHTIVRYARGEEILCQGRGSAANSVICYVLGITEIDPIDSNLLFERFLSAARREPPDIDVDFEHERREEVIQWVYDHYGRHRAALCATVMRYRTRGAVRDVGKALGLTEDVTAALAGQTWGWSEDGITDEEAAGININAQDDRIRLTLDLSKILIGFPRQLGTHPGGFVLTEDNLADLVPITPAAMKDRQVIEWDKDDINALRFMKVDVLGLGMLGCMRRAFELLDEHYDETLTLASIPKEDRATYAMISKADTLGTFQIESRAQMSMLPRLRPQTFYDLVIQVAIVRPGPIQGDMVHPYLKRRQNPQDVTYPTAALERVLKKTLGVPLFQEQAMQIAIHCAGFTPTEADQLRRSMATFKMTGGVSKFRDKLIQGMLERDYKREFAENTIRQIEGFGSYGFPESHAASFALIAYASAWMKCHHPNVFAAALLNSQPMGFYAPAQIVEDARVHGVEIRPVSAVHSRWDCTLEQTAERRHALRLGLRMAKGLSNVDAAHLVTVREAAPFTSVEDLADRTALPRTVLEYLAGADAFHEFGLDRRRALWLIRGLADSALPLFTARAAGAAEPEVKLTPMTEPREVVEDYRSTGLSLRAHPLSFLRPHLAQRGIRPCADLRHLRDGRRATLSGLILVRQRPGSAKGVIFVTIEDETGFANVVVWPSIFEANRPTILGARMLAVHGRVQKEGEVIHLIADRVENLSPLLDHLSLKDEHFPLQTARGDEAKHGGAPDHRTVTSRARSALRVPTRDFR